MKMYNILGVFNNVDPKTTPAAEEAKTEPTYENVEPRGSIMEAVKSLEEKYQGFKKTVAAIAKGGSAEDPEAVAAAIGRKKYGKAKFQKAAAAGKKLGEAAKPDYIDLDKDGDKTEPMKKAAKDAKKKTDEAIDPELLKAAGVGLATGALIPAASNLGYKAAEKIDKWLDKRSSAAAKKEYEAERKARLAKKSKKVAEGEYDPAPIDPEAVAKRKRLQALKDKQEDEHGYDTKKSNVRTVKGKAYGGAAQKDDADDLDEVAPPGAKAERMVKHIKKGYAKDGKLTKKEKGIAYATAWKAHNKGKLEESRMIQEGDYFYEKLGKALAEKDPTLNTADSSFVTAVRQEMVAQGIEPNRARNIIMMDDDFISDVATSYGHYCKEIAECGIPQNSHLGGVEELDEIARLAGLPPKEEVDEVAPALAAVGADLAAAAPAIAAVSAMKDSDLEEGSDEDLAEEEMGEGNEFSGALAQARASGAKEFEVDGKKYTVKEDVNINVSANGEFDSINLIRQLAGLNTYQNILGSKQASDSGPIDTDSQDLEVAEERDVEHTNTPREETAGLDAAIPTGADLNRAKKQYKKEYPGDNPMAVKEEALWKAYESMINDVKK